MTATGQGYPPGMSENSEHPTGSQDDAGDSQDPSAEAGYDADSDSDADPEMMNPRDLIGEGSGETDPDLDPDSLNPRGDA